MSVATNEKGSIGCTDHIKNHIFHGYTQLACLRAPRSQAFQNIYIARQQLNESGIDIAEGLDRSDWDFVVHQFQKRHLLAHRMGVVDQEYIEKTGSNPLLLGKKVSITEGDVMSLISHLKVIVSNLSKHVLRS